MAEPRGNWATSRRLGGNWVAAEPRGGRAAHGVPSNWSPRGDPAGPSAKVASNMGCQTEPNAVYMGGPGEEPRNYHKTAQ